VYCFALHGFACVLVGVIIIGTDSRENLMHSHQTPSEDRRFTLEQIKGVNCVFCVIESENNSAELLLIPNQGTALLIVHASFISFQPCYCQKPVFPISALLY